MNHKIWYREAPSTASAMLHFNLNPPPRPRNSLCPDCPNNLRSFKVSLHLFKLPWLVSSLCLELPMWRQPCVIDALIHCPPSYSTSGSARLLSLRSESPEMIKQSLAQ